jgi:hypothetical protein
MRHQQRQNGRDPRLAHPDIPRWFPTIRQKFSIIQMLLPLVMP